MKAHLRCFYCCCRAFLPKNEHAEDDSNDYYHRLNLESNASFEDIRRAYKKLSLRYHPDKMAQRGESATDQDDFQKLREAYEVLIDPRKRDLYDVLGPEAMQYILDSSQVDAMTIFNNFHKSGFLDKTKVFLYILLIVGMFLIQPILICAKVDQLLHEASWGVLCIPLWLLDTVVLGVLGYRLERSLKRKGTWGNRLLDIMKCLCVICAQILLVLKFDGSIDWNYYMVFIPIYLVELIRLVQSLSIITRTTRRISRMVTLAYIESHMGKAYVDMSDEEKEQVNRDYVIVHPATTTPDMENPPQGGGFQAAMLEDHVRKSPEYEKSSHARRKGQSALLSVALHVILIGLVSVRLDAAEGFAPSWWLVFLPVWIGAFLSCCCGFVSLIRSAMPDDVVTVLYEEKKKVKKSKKDKVVESEAKRKDGGDDEWEIEMKPESQETKGSDEEDKFVNEVTDVDRVILGSFQDSEVEVSLASSPSYTDEFKTPTNVKNLMVGTIPPTPAEGSLRNVVQSISVTNAESVHGTYAASPELQGSYSMSSISKMNSVDSHESHKRDQFLMPVARSRSNQSKVLPLSPSPKISFDTTGNDTKTIMSPTDQSFMTAMHTHDDEDKENSSVGPGTRENFVTAAKGDSQKSMSSIGETDAGTSQQETKDATSLSHKSSLSRQQSTSSQKSAASQRSRTSQKSDASQTSRKSGLSQNSKDDPPTPLDFSRHSAPLIRTEFQRRAMMDKVESIRSELSPAHSLPLILQPNNILPPLETEDSVTSIPTTAQDDVIVPTMSMDAHFPNGINATGPIVLPSQILPMNSTSSRSQFSEAQFSEPKFRDPRQIDEEMSSVHISPSKEAEQQPNPVSFSTEESEDEEEGFGYSYEYKPQGEDVDLTEKGGQAVGNCCTVMFVVTMVSLFVGKLEGATYSSFWVIFPILLPAGIITCCACCAVYCTPDLEALESYTRPEEEHQPEYGVDYGDDDEESQDYEAPAEKDVEQGYLSGKQIETTGQSEDEISVMSEKDKAIELVSVSSFNSKVSAVSGYSKLD